MTKDAKSIAIVSLLGFQVIWPIKYLLQLSIKQMASRKVWTGEEDHALRFLIEERGIVKWSQIAKIMEEEFKILGRNGKQCRERYHNHLAKNINNSDWSVEEQNLLFELQDQVGNKWALISSKLPGRTDNCIKNHFYSKLRKGLRMINKKIERYMKKEYKDITTSTLYKIIQTTEYKNRIIQNNKNDNYELCRRIKNQLRCYENQSFQNDAEQLKCAKNIVQSIAQFDVEIKKNPNKSSLKSNTKSENHSAASNGSKVSSTKSVYDDSSQYSNNSDFYSSSSFGNVSIESYHSHRKQLRKPAKLFRSQNIQSQSEDQNQINQQKNLYKSTNVSNKLTPKPLIKRQLPIKHQNSIKSSNQSKKSDKSFGQNRMYMFGQESLEMRVISPKKLTIQQKMQINDSQNDMLFYGDEMVIEDELLIKRFQGLNLIPPKLGHMNFD